MYKLIKKAYLFLLPRKLHYQLEPLIRRVMYHLFYKGNTFYCPICNSHLKLNKTIVRLHIMYLMQKTSRFCFLNGSVAISVNCLYNVLKLFRHEFEMRISKLLQKSLQGSYKQSTISLKSNLPLLSLSEIAVKCPCWVLLLGSLL